MAICCPILPASPFWPGTGQNVKPATAAKKYLWEAFALAAPGSSGSRSNKICIVEHGSPAAPCTKARAPGWAAHPLALGDGTNMTWFHSNPSSMSGVRENFSQLMPNVKILGRERVNPFMPSVYYTIPLMFMLQIRLVIFNYPEVTMRSGL